jgi:hypothetical protein
LPTGAPCGGGTTNDMYVFPVVEADATTARMTISWTGIASGSQAMGQDMPFWYGTVGPVPYTRERMNGGTLNIRVQAFNAAGVGSNVLTTSVPVLKCSGQ